MQRQNFRKRSLIPLFSLIVAFAALPGLTSSAFAAGDDTLKKSARINATIAGSFDDYQSVSSEYSEWHSFNVDYAVDNNGILWGWSDARHSEFLGVGETNPDTWEDKKPIRILEGVKSVYSSKYCTYAAKTDGSLWAWGENLGGKLGDGSEEFRSEPVLVKGVNNVIYVDPGSSSTLSYAITEDHSLWQLGLTNQKIMDDVAYVNHAWDYTPTLAVKTDGTLMAWQPQTDFSSDVDVPPANAIAITTGAVDARIMDSENTCICVKKDGSVWIWKEEMDGSSLLKRIAGMEDVISLDEKHMEKTDGSIWEYQYNFDVADPGENSLTVVAKIWDVYEVAEYKNDGFVKSDGTLWVTHEGEPVKFLENIALPSAAPPQIPGETFTITATAGANGSITPSGAVLVNEGAEQKFTVAPNGGYKISDVLVDGNSVLALLTENAYTFGNVTTDHAISASFAYISGGGNYSGGGGVTTARTDPAAPAEDKNEKSDPAAGAEPGASGTAAAGFTDTASHWAADAIRAVVTAGLFNGVSETNFAPDGTMTRAMFVTVLARHAGGAATGGASFGDVPANLWYTNGVLWAAENGIVSGVGDGLFDPNGQITREQLAVMLYNYAKFAGIDTGGAADLSGFSDGASVSSWAREALAWLVSEDLVGGKPGGVLDPAGTATRAEVATILQRFLEIYFAHNHLTRTIANPLILRKICGMITV
ncbi:MAG: S-layer homology domain-containing protein [Clostridiales Family XIII bacterium]|nr:S-layer homology domain-containing protein [Clostridiales Family XIII bacterium]